MGVALDKRGHYPAPSMRPDSRRGWILPVLIAVVAASGATMIVSRASNAREYASVVFGGAPPSPPGSASTLTVLGGLGYIVFATAFVGSVAIWALSRRM